MKVLLYGKGWIAGIFQSMCEQVGWEVIQGGRVDDAGQVAEEVSKVNPDRVVAMIGRTHGPGFKTIDYLEQKGKLVENVRDNLYAPIILARACSLIGVHLTYLGTGCIFTYTDEKKIFDENDLPNFTGSAYSTVKGFTDRLMHDLFDDSVLNVRIRMPIHSEPNERNFIDKIVNYEKICSIPNSMTVLDDCLPVLIDHIRDAQIGTLNLCNPGVIDHNEVLQMYKDIVDPNHTWENFNYEEQMKILAAGRSNNELDCSYLQSRYPDVDIRSSLRRCLEKYRENKTQQ